MPTQVSSQTQNVTSPWVTTVTPQKGRTRITNWDLLRGQWSAKQIWTHKWATNAEAQLIWGMGNTHARPHANITGTKRHLISSNPMSKDANLGKMGSPQSPTKDAIYKNEKGTDPTPKLTLFLQNLVLSHSLRALADALTTQVQSKVGHPSPTIHQPNYTPISHTTLYGNSSDYVSPSRGNRVPAQN